MELTTEQRAAWDKFHAREVTAANVLSYVGAFAGQGDDDETAHFVETAAKMVDEGKTVGDFGMCGYAHFTEWLAEQPEWLAGFEVGRDELEDEVCDAITDSLDMDWTGSDGAKAVLQMFEHRGYAVIKARPEP